MGAVRFGATHDWSWWQVLKRTVAEFRADNVTDWAAALTYYGVLSIFPLLIALVSVVGLLGSSATNSLLTNLQAFTPGPAKDILTNAVTGLSQESERRRHHVRDRTSPRIVVCKRVRRLRSCAPQTRSGTHPRGARFGKRCRCVSESPSSPSSFLPSVRWRWS